MSEVKSEEEERSCVSCRFGVDVCDGLEIECENPEVDDDLTDFSKPVTCGIPGFAKWAGR
jgi:hypothetical protein